MPTPDNYTPTLAPDRAIDTYGPCSGWEDLAEETLLKALSDIEEFSRELDDRGADVAALSKAVNALLADVAEWRNR